MSLHDDFYKLMNEYAQVFDLVSSTKNYKHPFGSFVRKEIPASLKKSDSITDNFMVKGSCGAGRYTSVPWIAVFDKRITTSAQRGVYIVYLLNKETKELFLTMNQGATDVSQDSSDDGKLVFTGIAASSSSKTTEKLRQRAKEIRSKIKPSAEFTTVEVITGSAAYDAGSICAIKYTIANLPEEDQLYADLEAFMALYRKYYDVTQHSDKQSEETHEEKGGETELGTKDVLTKVKAYIENKGFAYESGLIENFYLSLKSKPFVILAGTSGTGKTRLVKLFAEAVGANTNNGRYKMVSVRPDWSDSSDLFGHVDLNGKFVPGAIIDFVKRAELDITHPYFLCLDEMNLARVEYYLSDILSVIETRDYVNGRIVSDPLVSSSYYGTDSAAAGRYGTVLFPENLYIIGTVNMDETTFPFSKKVLDRANTIEFSYVDLLPTFEPSESTPTISEISNDFLKADYLLLAQCADQQDKVIKYCTELQNLNIILQQASAHVGYRVRDEIVFYLLNNTAADLLSEREAMDNAIMQKVLPRIQGSSASVKKMLCNLFRFCASDFEGYQTETDDISAKMLKVAQNPDCKYKKSANKIAFMVRRYEEDGFTSYWL